MVNKLLTTGFSAYKILSFIVTVTVTELISTSHLKIAMASSVNFTYVHPSRS